MYLSLHCKGSKRVNQGFTVRGSWRPNKTAIYWPHSYGHQRCVFLVLLMLNGRPGGSAFCWVLAFSTTSCHQQVSKTTGGPEGPFGTGVAFPTTSYQQLLWTPTLWGSKGPSPLGFLYHILSATSLDPNSIGGPEGPFGLAWLSLPHLVSELQLSDFLSWLSYITVQRPHSRPINLWNDMFDCHQAEITAMQFTGHSPPVHHSVATTVGPSPCPILSAELTCAIYFD